jgi:hypothetical protein
LDIVKQRVLEAVLGDTAPQFIGGCRRVAHG